MKIRTILMLGWLLGLAAVTGQEKKTEPNAASKEAPKSSGAELRKPLRLRIETWEAPALEVAKRLDELQDAASLAKLRTECLAGPAGVTLVSSPVLAIDSSTKELLESVTERIYPTEYEPPSLPGSFSGDKDKTEPPKNWAEKVEKIIEGITPTSFETRNTGLTLEADVEPVEGKQKVWNVRVALEEVNLVGRDTFGEMPPGIAMPVFTFFRVTGGLLLKEGQWRLLSVQEPPRGIEGKRADVRWVTLVRIDADE
jgi:hypothetical protein